jgi:hypothetical protein
MAKEPKLSLEEHVQIAELIKKMEKISRELTSIIHEAYGMKHEAVKSFGAIEPHLWRARYSLENNFFWEYPGLSNRNMVYTGPLGDERKWLEATPSLESEDTNDRA